jgi:hypothetical protein
MRTRQGVCVAEDVIDYVLEHEDCIRFDESGVAYVTLPPGL